MRIHALAPNRAVPPAGERTVQLSRKHIRLMRWFRGCKHQRARIRPMAEGCKAVEQQLEAWQSQLPDKLLHHLHHMPVPTLQACKAKNGHVEFQPPKLALHTEAAPGFKHPATQCGRRNRRYIEIVLHNGAIFS